MRLKDLDSNTQMKMKNMNCCVQIGWAVKSLKTARTQSTKIEEWIFVF